MSKVTKGKIVAWLYKRGPALHRLAETMPGHGSAQLGAKTKAQRELVQRAINYGRALEAETIRQMIEENHSIITTETE